MKIHVQLWFKHKPEPKIVQYDVSAVPRKDESLVIAGEKFIVQHIAWCPETDSVAIDAWHVEIGR